MNKSDVEIIIKSLFRDNLKAYPESYRSPTRAEGIARQVAVGYWVNRSDDEVRRDHNASVTQSDYEKWVVEELRANKK